MIRIPAALLGALLLAGCRTANPPGVNRNASEGTRTASPYSTGSDSGASRQRIEGTNTGAQLEAPQRIPGVLTALAAANRQPDKTNLSALRGGLGALEESMRNDFRRAGLTDTGAFHALVDTLSHQMGGGPGGMARLDPKDLPRVSSQVQRLIGMYQQSMQVTGK
jgi:hypothetical protein